MMDVQTRTQHDDDDDDTLFVNRDHRAETDDEQSRAQSATVQLITDSNSEHDQAHIERTILGYEFNITLLCLDTIPCMLQLILQKMVADVGAGPRSMTTFTAPPGGYRKTCLPWHPIE
jgi:hypothetical protein